MTHHPRLTFGVVYGTNMVLRLVTKDRVEITIPESLKRVLPLGILLVGLLAPFIAGCSHLIVDPAVSSYVGNSYALVMEGYGQKSQSGYVFIPITEGASLKYPVTITFPKTQCDESRINCSRVQFFRKDGTPGFAGTLARGASQISVTLGDILGHEGTVGKDDEGEYDAIARVYYLGNDGREYSMLSNGFVRVNVLNNQYRPLACGDPQVAWTQSTPDNCSAQFTTAFRSVVCGTCK